MRSFSSCIVDATDSKGEPIHQTLMAYVPARSASSCIYSHLRVAFHRKKMAKMAESNDFRPFKFRIQAFTNAFMDTVSIISPSH